MEYDHEECRITEAASVLTTVVLTMLPCRVHTGIGSFTFGGVGWTQKSILL